MAKWTRSTIHKLLGGRFQIVFTRIGALDKMSSVLGKPVDVTNFRGVPTQLGQYSSGDPFGDGTASFTFPSITGFDDFDSPEIGGWLADYSNVDLWWIPAVPAGSLVIPSGSPDGRLFIDGLTNEPDAIAPVYTYSGGAISARRGKKIWEGFVASMAFADSETGTQLEVQCQGALYQADRYLEKPFYPPNPQTLESLIAAVFDHEQRPHLRTRPLAIEWPIGWTKVAPTWNSQTQNVYSPNVAPGQKWSGYTSRQTGSWDRSLTGFVQDQIAVMLTQNDSGVKPGNQWTVLQERENSATYPAGRQPVLRVRDRFRTPDFGIWYGSDGVRCNLNRDTTQSANLYYGDGTGVDGTVWRNAVISHDGTRTDYAPLAADGQVYPATGNPNFNKAAFASEAYNKYGTGFNQPDAVVSAGQTLRRDIDAGWAGTITMTTDPSTTMTRWEITAGMTLKLKGFLGSGALGVNFHVSQVQASPMTGSVSLTVDTRYRDLLNLEQALARTRDPLTPSKLLQVNRDSAIIEDVQAPWDYTAGSGYVPLPATAFYNYVPRQQGFPYSDWSGKHPPFLHPSWYIGVNADAPDRKSRWTVPVPILMSEKGTIARAEFFCCDKYGVPIKIPFHVSLYYVNVTTAAMPFDGGGPSPFLDDAFTSTNPATGQPWIQGTGGKFNLPGDQSMIICWGNKSQPAGFSPGIYADASGPTGNTPTGLLEDDSTWTFDCTNNPNYNKQAKAGQKQPQSALTIYAAFYAEYTEPVYFQGRLYRQPQGV